MNSIMHLMTKILNVYDILVYHVLPYFTIFAVSFMMGMIFTCYMLVRLSRGRGIRVMENILRYEYVSLNRIIKSAFKTITSYGNGNIDIIIDLIVEGIICALQRNFGIDTDNTPPQTDPDVEQFMRQFQQAMNNNTDNPSTNETDNDIEQFMRQFQQTMNNNTDNPSTNETDNPSTNETDNPSTNETINDDNPSTNETINDDNPSTNETDNPSTNETDNPSTNETINDDNPSTNETINEDNPGSSTDNIDQTIIDNHPDLYLYNRLSSLNE